ncbi:MAG: ABC transporter ATP-binding protein [Desulfomonilaceae bacterium]|nr:ABC transporter ATP-binding protein [Desulfomonilaceae bacterium]
MEVIEVLGLRDVHAYYGDSHVLKGISFEIPAGRTATLLGRNGAGKTTTLRAIMGLVRAREGTIVHNDAFITNFRPHRIAARGVGYVPEERAVFPSLTVMENLTLPVRKNRRGLWDLERIFSHFPVLKARSRHMGTQLSGGEQQMLAIARVLAMDINVLLLDEPTEGLAPLLVREIASIIAEIKKERIAILLVEQNTHFAVEVADTHHVVYEGRVVYEGDSESFRKDEEVKRRYLGV